MTTEAFYEYEQAVMLLKSDLESWFPGVAVTSTPATAVLAPDYNRPDSHQYIDVSMVVVTNRARSATLAFVPVAVYESGEILASVALAGTLAQRLRHKVREVLTLRLRRPGDVWVCLGATPLSTGRFPTLNLKETLRVALL